MNCDSPYFLYTITHNLLFQGIEMHTLWLLIVGCIPFPHSAGSVDPNTAIVKVQDQRSAFITGEINDREGNPLPFATVFIANSTLGCISDEEGIYRLEHVPNGQHVLVVSFVGYETYEKRMVVNKERIEQDVQMIPMIVELDKVEVVEKKSKSTWRSNYRKFKNCFLGTTTNVSACEIINPEALRFRSDKQSKILYAEALPLDYFPEE